MLNRFVSSLGWTFWCLFSVFINLKWYGFLRLLQSFGSSSFSSELLSFQKYFSNSCVLLTTCFKRYAIKSPIWASTLLMHVDILYCNVEWKWISGLELNIFLCFKGSCKGWKNMLENSINHANTTFLIIPEAKFLVSLCRTTNTA